MRRSQRAGSRTLGPGTCGQTEARLEREMTEAAERSEAIFRKAQGGEESHIEIPLLCEEFKESEQEWQRLHVERQAHQDRHGKYVSATTSFPRDVADESECPSYLRSFCETKRK